MNKVKREKKSFYKPLKIILCAVLALIIAANIAYTLCLKNEQKKKEAALTSAVETAIEECMKNLEDFGITEEQKKYIALYNENMEKSTTPLQRAYIAETMLTYAANSTNTINSENISNIYQNGGTIQSKQYISDNIRKSEQNLRAAIYEYTIYDEAR